MTAAIDTELLALQERLRERRRELGKRLGKIQADRRRDRGPLDPDFAEQAVERENDEVLDQLDAAERRELEEIELALARADSGCFGVCDDCAQDIDPVRLAVRPAAALCIKCASARDQRAVS